MTGSAGPDADATLPCGRAYADAWDAADPEHEDAVGGCPHCAAVAEQRARLQAASTAYSDAWADTRTAPSTGFVDRVMRRVSLDLRPSVRLPLRAGDAAAAYVTDTAVGNALRIVLDGDPAVVMRRCRVEPADAPAGMRVWLTVAVSYDHYGRHGDDEVRAQVVAAVDDLFGRTVEAVDIDVVDVFTERAAIGSVT